MGRTKDRFWEYAEELPRCHFRCRFCELEFAGGATRIKSHLSNLPCRDIAPCEHVPLDVQQEAFREIGGPNKKPKRLPATSSNFDKNNSTASASSSLVPSNALHLYPITAELPAGDNNKIEADKLLVRWLVSNDIPIEVVQTPSFTNFLQHAVKCDPEYTLPSHSTLEKKLIPDLEKEVEDYVSNIEKSWATTGCTLMLNLRRDKKHGDFIDINAYSHKGVVFIKSVELLNKSNEELETILCSVIEKIGPDKVVQLITNDKKLESIGDVIVHKYPRIYMTRCAARGIELLLKQTCEQVSWLNKVIKDAYSIVKYMHQDDDTLSLTRKYIDKELKLPRVTRFSSHFWMLQSVSDVKRELQLLVASAEWRKMSFNKEDKRREIANIIGNAEFWSQVPEILQVLKPIVRVLQLAEIEGPTFAYLYEAVERAKEEIKQKCGDNQGTHMQILEIFEEKYSRNIIHPVHAAAARLNPSYMCKQNFQSDLKMDEGIDFILKNLVAVEDEQDFAQEFLSYHKKELKLFTKTAELLITSHPYDWWELCGHCVRTLRKYSIRILSQPCSCISSLCKQNWSALEALQTKKGNQLSAKTSEKFVHLKTNAMMMEKSHTMETRALKPIDLNNLSELPDYVEHEQDWEDDPLMHVIDKDLNTYGINESYPSQLQENVGEYVAHAFLKQLVSKLDSIELQEFVDKMQVNIELNTWQKFLVDICAVLDDAEEKQMEDSLVKKWLRDIRDLAYEADDILDEIGIEALRLKLMVESQASLIDVQRVIPVSNTSLTEHNITSSDEFIDPLFCTPYLNLSLVNFNTEMATKIDVVTSKLRNIVSEIHKLNLRKKVEKRTSELKEASFTTPLVCGRDKDKEGIIKLLLGDDGCEKVVIVGEAGVGKTTLARLVYDDAIVSKCFDRKAWAYVSQEWDVHELIKSILWERSGGTDVSADDPFEEKFLIVLDNVLNVSYDQWFTLHKFFKKGAFGSKVVVTTRAESDRSAMGSITSYYLEKLSFQDSLSLFTHHTQGLEFCDGLPNLKVIGEKIVRMCKGLPLAVKIFAGLLRSKLDSKDWEDILNNETWGQPEEEYGLLSILRLGYHHLPSHLKRCLVYCAIFPKGYEFGKDELVSLWMAEEFLLESKGKYHAKDLGLQYFSELVSRSFFRESYGNQSSFVMPDLISDLAKSIAGEICFDSKRDTLNKAVEKVRHLSFTARKYDSFERFGVFSQMKGLRTFLALNTQVLRHDYYLSSKVLHELLPQLRYLRVLSLRGYQIKALPESIRVLKHLRHLNLSYSAIESLPESLGVLKHLKYLNLAYSAIKRLPESLSALLSLKTLILHGCKELIELPSTIGNLVELNHLDIFDTHRLRSMPLELRKLTNLQTLPKFIVGGDNELRDLGNFPNLQGQLSILGLCNVAEINDVEVANLEGMQGLDELTLAWSHDYHYIPKLVIDDPFLHLRELQVFDLLQPHRNLKELRITSYAGKQFPTWIGDSSFSNLQQLSIRNCKASTFLPSLGRLPLLNTLSVEGMDALQFINEGFYGFDFPPFKAFPSLESLRFRNMSKWEVWYRIEAEGVEIFPHLRKLELEKCPKLIGELPRLLGSLDELHISSCPMLQTSFVNLPSLRELTIENCNWASLSGLVNLTSLTTMKIDSILDLFVFNIEFLNALEVLEIKKCNELITLWEGGVNPSNLAGLKKLVIKLCHKLTSLAGEEGWLLPPNLEELKIEDCSSLVKLPNGLHSLTRLKSLTIKYFHGLVSFPSTSLPYTLKQLQLFYCGALESLPDGMMMSHRGNNNHCFLEELVIDGCHSLKSIPRGFLPTTLKKLLISDCGILDLAEGMMFGDSESGNDNPSQLKSLEIKDCEQLKSVSERIFLNNTSLEAITIDYCVNLRSLPLGCLDRLVCLRKLTIDGCDALESFPDTDSGFSIPNLTSLEISSCRKLKSLPSQMHNFTSLQKLIVTDCEEIVSFPEGGLPPNLTALKIEYCKNLKQPISEWGLHRLTCMRELTLRGITGAAAEVISFPDDECCMLPTSLTHIFIGEFHNLKSISKGLQCLTSLQKLGIADCSNLRLLPKEEEEEGEGLPASLGCLEIDGSPVLEEEISLKEYWPIIPHIPFVSINYGVVFDFIDNDSDW